MKTTALLLICTLTLITTNSCNKDDEDHTVAPEVNYASAFIGNYPAIQSTCGVPSFPLNITSTQLNTINLPIHVGIGVLCTPDLTIVVPVHVSGNAIVPTSVTRDDSCGNKWIMVLSGNISNNFLTLSYTWTLHTDSGDSTTPCTFTGSKN